MTVLYVPCSLDSGEGPYTTSDTCISTPLHGTRDEAETMLEGGGDALHALVSPRGSLPMDNRLRALGARVIPGGITWRWYHPRYKGS